MDRYPSDISQTLPKMEESEFGTFVLAFQNSPKGPMHKTQRELTIVRKIPRKEIDFTSL